MIRFNFLPIHFNKMRQSLLSYIPVMVLDSEPHDH